MSKRSLLFVGPVMTASGYGTHARQVLKAVVDSGKFEVFVESIRWGETSFIFDDSEVGWINPYIANREAAGDRRFDISIQVTIPNEFRKVARLNVGVTAGIEVDRVSPTWIQKVNDEVDVLVVPSQHSLRAFIDTRYQTQSGDILALQRPVVVVAESAPDSFFLSGDQIGSYFGPDVPEKNLLVVGLGLDRPLGEDRKNISNTLLWFLREFKDRQDVGLILKTSIVNGSLMDRELTLRRIKELKAVAGVGEFPKITLIHGRMSEDELRGLYGDKRVTALISLTHGEGFGLPLLEAAARGLPIVATSWSGHLDFLVMDGQSAYVPVQHTLVEIPKSAVWDGVMERGSRWADVSEESARIAMRTVLSPDFRPYNNPDYSKWLRDNFCQETLQTRLVGVIAEAWQHVVDTRPETRDETVAAIRRQMNIQPGEVTLLYTMPMSAGDVYLSTAIVTELRRKHHPYPEKIVGEWEINDHGEPVPKYKTAPYRVIFATKSQYRTILEDNPDIDEIVEWQPWMQDVGLLEDVFTHVYTPNLAIQMMWSNWVHRGKGRNIFYEMAVQCNVDYNMMGGPKIGVVPVQGLPARYVVIHTGSGKGQWGARRYNQWQDVVDNLLGLSDILHRDAKQVPKQYLKGVDLSTLELPEGFEATEIDPHATAFDNLKVVQVGLPDEPQIRGAIDFRGKTPDYRQLAYVVARAEAVVSIDSFVMHLAAHHAVTHVALFGGSYASSTGTAYGGEEMVAGKPYMSGAITKCLIETTDRMGCDRACYKNECKVDQDSPCINNIPAKSVLLHLIEAMARRDAQLLNKSLTGVTVEHAEIASREFKVRRPSISGYTHTVNAKTHGYPFIQSIKSMLGFCSEVVVIDGGSTDGTLEDIIAIGDPRVKVINNPWDKEEPGMDGVQKAFGRVMTDPSAEFLWQQDCDEVVHEDDYEKVLDLARRFPPDVKLLHLPVIELWGDDQHFRTDRHAWKWRLSRNEFEVTHGIVKHARLVGKDGRTYAKEGMSDGCEYIDVMTGEYMPHKGFWNGELESLRQTSPTEYGRRMNEVFGRLPSVFHYSWADLPRKVRNFRDFWDDCWSQLYRIPARKRFPDVVTEEDVQRKALELFSRGGEHSESTTIELARTAPKIMIGWINGTPKTDGVCESSEGGHPLSQTQDVVVGVNSGDADD